MEPVSIDKLKNSRHFVEGIRWDVTPRIFLEPKSSAGENVDVSYGYMLYVDIVKKKPTLVIMQLRFSLSKTVGYVEDVPDELLKETMDCTTKECIAGMYPLTERLEVWLKKEFGLS